MIFRKYYLREMILDQTFECLNLNPFKCYDVKSYITMRLRYPYFILLNLVDLNALTLIFIIVISYIDKNNLHNNIHYYDFT